MKRAPKVKRTLRTFVEFRGERLCLKDIAKRTGIAYQTITLRYRRGRRGEDLVTPVTSKMARPKKRIAA